MFEDLIQDLTEYFFALKDQMSNYCFCWCTLCGAVLAAFTYETNDVKTKEISFKAVLLAWASLFYSFIKLWVAFFVGCLVGRVISHFPLTAFVLFAIYVSRPKDKEKKLSETVCPFGENHGF